MRNPEERAALDEFELADEYDFPALFAGVFTIRSSNNVYFYSFTQCSRIFP